MSIDWTKPIQTNGGRKARLLGTFANQNGNGHVVAVDIGNGNERIQSCYPHGGTGHHEDVSEHIINAPERSERFINIYAESGVAYFVHPTLEEAKRTAELTAKTPPIGHLKIVMENGKAVKAEIV